MSLIEIVFLSLALGIDCLIVSFSQGLIFTSKKKRNSLLLASTMGIFQGLMPLISYYPTGFIYQYISKYSSIIIFAIFISLGIKFITEAFSCRKENPACKIDFKCLMAMGIATSIDALGAGVNLKLSDTNIILSVSLIAIASFIMSLTGFWTGNKISKIPSKTLEIAGGLILIGLAIKALV